MKRWSNYSQPGNLSLHDAILQDSILVTSTIDGNMTYVFDLDNKKLIMSNEDGWINNFEIVEVFQTNQSVFNVDARKNDIFYNFMLTEDITDNMTLVGQNFDVVEGKRIGMFSKSLSYTIK
jgi:hypothetical protein